jgi:hypothetical protein
MESHFRRQRSSQPTMPVLQISVHSTVFSAVYYHMVRIYELVGHGAISAESEVILPSFLKGTAKIRINISEIATRFRVKI